MLEKRKKRKMLQNISKKMTFAERKRTHFGTFSKGPLFDKAEASLNQLNPAQVVKAEQGNGGCCSSISSSYK